MTSSRSTGRRLAQIGCVLGVGLAVVIGLTVACNLQAPGGGGGRPVPSPTGCLILNLPGNFQVGVGSEFSLTVIYNIDAGATNVRGFSVPVASAASDAPEIGDDVIVAEGLSAGDGHTFNVQLGQLAAGFYRVGIRAVVDGAEGRCVSAGTLELTSTPQPEFPQPCSDVVVGVGEDVQIGFDVHDTAGAIHWRLLYISTNGYLEDYNDPLLGETIKTGAGNSDVVVWNTGMVAVGVYYVALSTTDSGLSVEDTVAAGREAEVRTLLNPCTITVQEAAPPVSETSPSIEVTQPAARVQVPFGEPGLATIAFTATIRDPAAVNPKVDLFLDLDNQPGSGNELAVASGLAPDASPFVLDTEVLDEKTYYVYARVDDWVNPAVTDYAPGRIEVSVHAPSLQITKPNLTLPVQPGTSVSVEWRTTNVEPNDAKVDVFREAMTIGTNGQPTPTGPEIVILASTNGVTKTSFVPTQSGLFRVSVRLKFTDTSKADLIARAPSLVRVSTLPLIMWVGDLATFNPSVESKPKGAIFEGHNFEDNAGSAFAGGEDFDQDGVADFVVAARYAKPEFINPTGIGDGEAYLIRGNPQRYRGSYNLNQTSSPQLPGVVMTGIRTPFINLSATPPLTTYGIASVFISTDADGDGVGELLFGFPYTSNFRQYPGDLFADRIFENGGVVTLSSRNNPVRGVSTYDTIGTRIRLDRVGQDFQDDNVIAEPDDSPLCSDTSLWSGNFYTYFEGDCPEEGKCTVNPGNPPDPAVGTCSDGITACVPNQTPSGCPPDVPPYISISGCLLNGDWRLEGDVDGNYDTLIGPEHGFNGYWGLGVDFVNLYAGLHGGAFPCTDYGNFADGATPGRPFPCPSCWDPTLSMIMNPNNPPGCSCEQWTRDPTTGKWVVNIDPANPASVPFCQDIVNDLNSFDPLALDVPGDPPPPLECDPQNSNIQFDLARRRPLVDRGGRSPGAPDPYLRSGFYRDRITGAETDPAVNWNDPVEPLGAWIIGRRPDPMTTPAPAHEEYSAFGSSITQSGPELIISAPTRDAITGTTIASTDGEVVIIDDISALLGTNTENEDAGVAYLFTNTDLWTLGLQDNNPADPSTSGIPPKPHIYLAGGHGHTGVPPTCTLSRRDIELRRPADIGGGSVWGGLAIAGRTNENIENTLGIPDFNRDNRPDFVVGAPLTNNADGVAYIAFRRTPSLEGDYVLDKLTLAPSNVERLAGIYVIGNAGEQGRLGASLAGGNANAEGAFDFNGDGYDDVAIGIPNGNNGTGAVLILFGTNQLTSPLNGISVNTLLDQWKAALITGDQVGGGFGFNVANAGDIDGDGTDDLLIAAPYATPRFDGNPIDSTDELNSNGLDRNLDGIMDDVTGPTGVPDGVLDAYDQLQGAGLVYVVFSSVNTASWATGPMAWMTISIDQLGKTKLPGFIIVGRRTADELGGGDPADALLGNPNKPSSPSRGLAGIGDVDGDGKGDILIGSVLADPRVDPLTGVGTVNGGEAYLIYGFAQNSP